MDDDTDNEVEIFNSNSTVYNEPLAEETEEGNENNIYLWLILCVLLVFVLSFIIS